MGEAALLEPDDAAWADALTRVRHDVYHLPQYARLDARLSSGTPVAFRYDDAGHALLLPLVLRTVPDTDLRDAVSPYGYPGPVSDAGPADTAFWSDAGRAMADLLCARGVVTAFVRLHPLLPAPTEALAAVGTVVHHGQTVSVDLSLSPEEMWTQTHRTHRNQINKARRAGVEIVVDDWDRLDEWIGTYHANMRRVGAADFYFFTPDHFHRLRAELGDRVHLAVALAGDELLGGNLFFEHDGIMHTHLQATRDGRTHWADKLLYHEIRRWGRHRGNHVYHLGGGVGGAADSLFEYKAAFAAGRHDYHTWRVIADGAAVVKLAGAAPAPDQMTGRFPPYR
ncbi:MAG TPA: GNAT family N-acetyltransferase [Actinoplanes sp.]|nr:GNAT family N-acetyltransferase [Actinoplanes sp.]